MREKCRMLFVELMTEKLFRELKSEKVVLIQML